MPLGHYISPIEIVFALPFVCFIFWAIYRIIRIFIARNKKGVMVALTSSYGILTLIKLFTAVVDDNHQRIVNLVLKRHFTVLNNLFRPDLDSSGADGLIAGWINVKDWYLQGNYIHIANLTQNQWDWYNNVIKFWWIATWLIIPIYYIWLELRELRVIK